MFLWNVFLMYHKHFKEGTRNPRSLSVFPPSSIYFQYVTALTYTIQHNTHTDSLIPSLLTGSEELPTAAASSLFLCSSISVATQGEVSIGSPPVTIEAPHSSQEETGGKSRTSPRASVGHKLCLLTFMAVRTRAKAIAFLSISPWQKPKLADGARFQL